MSEVNLAMIFICSLVPALAQTVRLEIPEEYPVQIKVSRTKNAHLLAMRLS